MTTKKEAANLPAVDDAVNGEVVDGSTNLATTGPLDKAQSETLDKRLRDADAAIGSAFDNLLNLMERAAEGRIWKQLTTSEGKQFRNVVEYFNDAVTFKPSDAAERRLMVEAMSDKGFSLNTISEVLGIDKSTASRDRAGVAARNPSKAKAIKSKGADGKEYTRDQKQPASSAVLNVVKDYQLDGKPYAPVRAPGSVFKVKSYRVSPVFSGLRKGRAVNFCYVPERAWNEREISVSQFGGFRVTVESPSGAMLYDSLTDVPPPTAEERGAMAASTYRLADHLATGEEAPLDVETVDLPTESTPDPVAGAEAITREAAEDTRGIERAAVLIAAADGILASVHERGNDVTRDQVVALINALNQATDDTVKFADAWLVALPSVELICALIDGLPTLNETVSAGPLADAIVRKWGSWKAFDDARKAAAALKKGESK